MKNCSIQTTIAAIAACLALTGCASKVAETTQYSGFLQDYSQLKVSKSASGHKVLRWTAPGFTETDYRGVYFSPLTYYPAASPNTRVSQETLEKIKQYASEQLKAALVERTTVLPSPSGSRVLIARGAITAVTAENEDLQFYEVVPVAAVIASTMAASGHRTQNTTLFLEFQLVDQDTGQTVLAVVRKGYGKSVSNSNTPITADEVKKAIDDMIEDIVNFPRY